MALDRRPSGQQGLEKSHAPVDDSASPGITRVGNHTAQILSFAPVTGAVGAIVWWLLRRGSFGALSGCRLPAVFLLDEEPELVLGLPDLFNLLRDLVEQPLPCLDALGYEEGRSL